ncbi:hypothetical protein FRC12_003182 [Ceratobasidium sp. 428]|nr:hypothetical protein FRC12_003182 [Ceratobasidium sp. 428]
MDSSAPDVSQSNPYFKTFNRWKKVYEQLVSVLDSFSLECTQLSLASQHPEAREWIGLEESLAYVDAAFASLDAGSPLMSNVHATLGTVRNQSKSLVSFNRLPDEVVAYILLLVNADDPVNPRYESYPTEQPISPLFSIMTTSRHLRDTIINTPSLWTYINLVVEDPEAMYLPHGQRCLLYSQQLPLQVHITGHYLDEDEGQIIENLTRLLGSHAHRIASLDFWVPMTCAWPVLLSLFSDTPSCQIRVLYLNDPDAYPEDLGDDFPDRLFEGDLDTFLRSLQVLGMRGFFIPLTTPAYRDLTILEIMPYSFKLSQPRLEELRNALVACPRLRSLALIECTFETGSGVPVEPVLLLDLEILDLRLTNDDDELVALMACIDSGTNELAFSVSLDPDMSEDTMARLRNFIKQSNITRLCIDATIDRPDLDWLLALPQGETLTIRELALCSYDVTEASFKPPLSTSRFPSLHTLHLMGWKNLDIRICRQILDTSTIQVLRFDEPRAIVQEMIKVAPFVEPCWFSTGVSKDSSLEWPVYVFP